MKSISVRLPIVITLFCAVLLLSCSIVSPFSRGDGGQSTMEAMSAELTRIAGGQVQTETQTSPAAPAEGASGQQATLPPGGNGLVGNQNPSGELELLGQYGGSAFAVAVQGDNAFLGQGPRFVVLDISEADQPVLLGQSELLPGVVQGIALRDDLAYVVYAYGGMAVFDVSSPQTPRLLSSLKNAGCNGITLEGSQALLACNPAGFLVVDISDPDHLAILGESEQKGAMVSIANRGDTSYVVDWTQQGLAIFDHSNPAAPRQVSLFNPSELSSPSSNSGLFESVRSCGEYLCLTDMMNGLVILDISSPDAPAVVSVTRAGIPSGLAVDGDTVFVLDDMEGLLVFDISNPAEPALLGALPGEMDGEEYKPQQTAERGMAFSDGNVFITDAAYGVDIINVNMPSSPQRLARYHSPVPWTLYDISVQEQTAYVVGINSGFRVVDVSDPANMRELGFDDSRKDLYSQSPTGLAVDGNYASISDSNYPFHIYDLSDPSEPDEVGAVYDHAAPDGAADIAVAGTTAYVSGWGAKDAFYPGDGLWVIDISDPQNPQEVKFVDLPNAGWQLAISGSTLYALDLYGADGGANLEEPLSLRVIDISSPSNPVPGAVIPFPQRTPIGMGSWDVKASQKRLYISLSMMELKMFDISDPASPVDMGTYPLYFSGSGKMAVEGGVLAAGIVQAYDVSQDGQPALIASAPMDKASMESWSYDIEGDLVYVATSRHGIYVYRILPPD